ncbi:hypothetical protein J2T07_001138 [Luteibacter jiangsuensis]|uniref:Uncharacterized protein n=1 Tax=Luteibacter jiangsuensis TaxID=637577 RepID=A0ABT9SX50_9GAMM|nr:hypothetical protein [Luteibacter jiangsuensis]MDQ0008961.1 hypothetical protein [Luteibacter jiangsuensis]
MNRGKANTFLGVLLLGLSSAAGAQVKIGETCTSEFPVPPALVETGLGTSVDDLAHSAYALQWRLAQVKREGWIISYGSSSATDKIRKTITIVDGQSQPYSTSHLSHEVGHATSYFGEDLSSREAYIRTRCIDEGFALGRNIVARQGIKQCAGVDVGVVSADVPYFTQWYESMAARPPVVYGDFGYAFCEKNVESVSGKNYLDYYGDWYDSHVMAPSVSTQQVHADSFFERVAALANQAGGTVDDLRNAWPGGERSIFIDRSPGGYHSGSAPFVDGIDIIKSELRLKYADKSRVVLATMDIVGQCISLDMVRARYPAAIMTDSPTTAMPDDEGAWSAFGPWGEIGFGFAYANPKCVSSVTFKPDAFPPPWAGSML